MGRSVLASGDVQIELNIGGASGPVFLDNIQYFSRVEV